MTGGGKGKHHWIVLPTKYQAGTDQSQPRLLNTRLILLDLKTFLSYYHVQFADVNCLTTFLIAPTGTVIFKADST